MSGLEQWGNGAWGGGSVGPGLKGTAQISGVSRAAAHTAHPGTSSLEEPLGLSTLVTVVAVDARFTVLV